MDNEPFAEYDSSDTGCGQGYWGGYGYGHIHRDTEVPRDKMRENDIACVSPFGDDTDDGGPAPEMDLMQLIGDT